jgi:glycosyltransferase involved in cell wall biosynthesis
LSDKKRILAVAESSFRPTGFGSYGLEVLSYLHATGKYEILELGCFGTYGDVRASELPWKFETALPNPEIPEEVEKYNSSATNSHGDWKFEAVCCDHRPHIVLDWRDIWCSTFECNSPFRPFYHLAIAPTIDAIPLMDEWVDNLVNADAVFTYSDWWLPHVGSARDKIEFVGNTPPGADLDTFSVRPKAEHRRAMGVEEDALIIGFVCRNQKRKLIPDLMEAFSIFLQEAPPAIAKRACLYIHTGFPDLAWNIPRLLKETGLGHKVLFTYHCTNCGAAYPDYFQDAIAVCRSCNQTTARMHNDNLGVPRKVLADVYNLFDVYVQLATNEGFGMPLVEAAACGVPVMAVDYSAMGDVVRKLKGTPLPVARYTVEQDSHRRFAFPAYADLVRELVKILSMPNSARAAMGFAARKAVEDCYAWGKTAKKWEAHVDSVAIKPDSETWDSPPRIHRPNLNVPQGLTNSQFVTWALINIAGRPDMLTSHFAIRMVRDLNYQACAVSDNQGKPANYRRFTRENVVSIMMHLCDKKNHFEQLRCSQRKKT